ncbi:4-hydroxyphenylpyruvate dioxygenase [Chitinophaga ginsengisegetis]|uniref:4-hydroxyphenylpyruvate dioxygenase n=1 Tax=Chitinophaga ginsengisegetis TaxID=393003 RepID=A0A1T5N9F5_9BACT|nr:4-hydroxyphenylpyruvate dioxygenase [Chitinophaga ginsengisegetis]MDR6568421.1 4-hydroxyphenylpyruvate dioxygenase [Chitinophaga ginsengisegetis]MDR6648348.1 4-hydroxyphenylpyruvate dioxygenase [Chitinophaga ginsengisegetis]MDR6654502.1 4-hydroxyphenylpyruvate dioxygenase [Chitinophaga ginsengisegetis]SKC97056.1 4-hydroxyphenylpyruvate dioxygenase [Chitinophaga ginsengisegetis]
METALVNADNLTGQQDFLPLNGTDYVEFYVGNAKQAAHYYKTAFGFQSVAYAGPETGVKDRVSYVLVQNKLRFVLTTSLLPDTEIARHVAKHGDGVKVLALWVDDARSAYEETVKRGATPYLEPVTEKDEFGEVVRSGIHTYGDTVHLFIERKNYKGLFMPGFKEWKTNYNPTDTGLLYVDHCVGNVGWNEMNTWVGFYERVMGFRNLISFDDSDISTEYSALMSKVMSNGNGRVKFPINEPAEGKKKSQIEEYLDFYGGPGVQHVAIATNDIVKTVTELQNRGVEFLTVPPVYYETLLDRVGKIDEEIAPLQKLGILVDRDDEGYLLQIFTKPIQDRPTVFFEIIQRKGAQSFGKGNFKALFESIEREQALRGNL